jgi:hypothetical protein
MPALYTPAEVLWLLSMDREQAIACDSGLVSQLQGMTPDGMPGAGSSGGDDRPLMVICRWHDVHGARVKVVVERLHQQVLSMRSREATDPDVAAATGLSKTTMRRRFEGALAAVVDELNAGDPAPEPRVVSGPDACLMCGTGVRARITASRGAGVRRTSVCAGCLAPELHDRLVAA